MDDICSKCGKLSFHRQNIRGKVQDYVITFNDIETSVEEVIEDTFELSNKLMDKFKDKTVKARSIAKIEFAAIRDNREMEVDHYHFTSHQAEYVEDRKEFFIRYATDRITTD